MFRLAPASVCAVASATVLAGTALTGTAWAATPPPTTRLLDRAADDGAVHLSAQTSGRRRRVWLHQTRGAGVARGKASVECRSESGGSTASSVSSFTLTSRRGQWRELWRSLGGDCTIDVTLRTDGRIAAELRGR
jgi:hypothetical protein